MKRLAALALFLPLAAFAQSYPSKPVRLVVPFPAGGAADITARMVGQKMAERMGQPMIIENRVGASGFIGSEFVARSAPDGYTLLWTTPSTHLSAVFLSKNMPYDPIKDFTPIGAALESFSGMVIGMHVPVTNVAELVEYAKKNPGKLTFSSSGIGSEFHLTGELFKQAAGIDMLHVPYKGAAPALIDLVAGNISMTLATMSALVPTVKAGKARLIGVLNPNRNPDQPDVPSVSETVRNFQKISSWQGMFGPAKLPDPLLRRLNSELGTALNAPDLMAKWKETSQRVIITSPEEFMVTIRNGLEAYGKAVKAVGLKPE
jgi:tripartite-type tricarboxylate transporter receptor subunit TctC